MCTGKLIIKLLVQKMFINDNKFDPCIVNFTNILQAAFAPISFCQKITNPNCKHNKSSAKHFHMKTLLIKWWKIWPLVWGNPALNVLRKKIVTFLFKYFWISARKTRRFSARFLYGTTRNKLSRGSRFQTFGEGPGGIESSVLEFGNNNLRPEFFKLSIGIPWTKIVKTNEMAMRPKKKQARCRLPDLLRKTLSELRNLIFPIFVFDSFFVSVTATSFLVLTLFTSANLFLLLQVRLKYRRCRLKTKVRRSDSCSRKLKGLSSRSKPCGTE